MDSTKNMPNEVTKTRTPEIVAAEIRTFTASMLNSIIEIGRRMCEAKEMLEHGEFIPWIEQNTGYSQSTANNFMRLYREYGEEQGSLFGTGVSNSQTFGNLTYSKALALLALPAQEREEFVETHAVDDMTTAELKAVIRERDEARKALQTTQARLEDTQRTLADSGNMNTELQRKLAQARADIKTADDEAAENERQLKERIKELESRPIDVAVQVDEEAVKKAAAEARAASEAEWSKKLQAAEDKLAKAEKKAKDAADKAKSADGRAEERTKELREEAENLRTALEQAKQDAAAEAEALRKKLAMSGKELTVFQLRFGAWQEAYLAVKQAFPNVDEERKPALRSAIRQQIDAWRKEFADE